MAVNKKYDDDDDNNEIECLGNVKPNSVDGDRKPAALSAPANCTPDVIKRGRKHLNLIGDLS